MDYVLIGICAFMFLKGVFKGFVSTLFSFFGTFFIIFLAWWLSEFLVEFLKNIFDLNGLIAGLLNSKFSGTFTNMKSLVAAITQTGGVFLTILLKMLGDITFEGELTAGEILAPSLSNIAYKIIAFVLLFVVLMLSLSLIKFLLNKFVKTCGLGIGNKVLGGVLGLVQGLVIFGVFFFIISSLGNLLLNENILNFVKSGNISNYIYENIIIKSINLIF